VDEFGEKRITERVDLDAAKVKESPKF